MLPKASVQAPHRSKIMNLPMGSYVNSIISGYRISNVSVERNFYDIGPLTTGIFGLIWGT